MKLHVFICASPLYPQDKQRDEALHIKYLERLINQCPLDWVDWAQLTILQNGCVFPHQQVGVLRNPIPKNVSYNWLFCDANCEEDYWLFLPEDCVVSQQGWDAIRQHMEKGKECFSLSKDPKAFVCRRGIFQGLSVDLQIMCDMNALGKEIGCVLLRGELEQKGFHCISKNWCEIPSGDPKKWWGNELYQEMREKDHPEVNKMRGLPTFHDYGLEGYKASREVIESTFLKIIEKILDRQRQAAEKKKELISHYGPLVTELPYKGMVQEMLGRILGS